MRLLVKCLNPNKDKCLTLEQQAILNIIQAINNMFGYY